MFWLRNDEYDDDDTDFKVYFYDFYIVTERGAAALMGMPNWQSDLSWIMKINFEISILFKKASFVWNREIISFFFKFFSSYIFATMCIFRLYFHPGKLLFV